MKFWKYSVVLFFVSIAPLVLQAQSAAPEAAIEEDIVIATAPLAAGAPGEERKFLFISADMEHGGKLIKGAPYSAEAITERTQTLADGNRIVNKSSAKVYRDSEGRTRREQQIAAIGNWEATEAPPNVVFIQDPVEKVHYVLEPENKIARKIKADQDSFKWAPAAGETFEKKILAHPAPHAMSPGEFGASVMHYKFDEKDAKKESLGKQTIEGLVVEGTRTTMTIAAGQMGNELPIQIVSERWYSPDLQVNVLTRHSDPRFGETVYQLTQIARGEQDRSLFEVPKDYKIEDSPIRHKIIKREKTQ